MKKSWIICIITGIILLLIGLSTLFTFPIIILKLINSKLSLITTNPTFELWKDLPLPIFQKFYLFNVSNYREVEMNGQKPQLKQIGPFVYRMDIKKSKINFSDCEESVTFTETMTYYFERQLSSEDEHIVITTINAPLAIAMGLIEPLPLPMRSIATLFIDFLAQPFFVQKEAKELLFDGYPDLLTKFAPMLNPKIPYQSNFGWMYDKNVTEDGLFKVNTGKTDLNKLNSIETLDGLPQLTYWSGNRCNSLNGAKNGELFNPIASDQKSVLFFRTNFCRMWTMISNSAFKSYLGNLFVYRFLTADNIFANFTDYPPNSCFTPNSTQNDVNIESLLNQIKKLLQNNNNPKDWEKFLNKTRNLTLIESYYGSEVEGMREFASGVFSMSGCHYGAPIYLSFPHFFKADPIYLDTVTGLKPNATLHETYIDIEPITGSPVDVAARVQLNVFVNPPKALYRYRNMPKIIFPVFWEEFTIHMTQEIAKNLHWSLTVPQMIATIISSLFVATGLLILLYIISKPVWKRLRHKSDLISDSDSDALITDNCDQNNITQPVIG